MGTPAIDFKWCNTEFVQVTSPSVNVTALDGSLVSYLIELGMAHKLLFGTALEITSGNDGNHVPGSAHFKNKAVDIRCHDLLDDAQALFFQIMAYAARAFKVAVFDERYTASPHWHIQTADSVGG